MRKNIINDKQLKPYNPIGDEEVRVAIDVLKSGRLSGFVASSDERFYGGDYVKKFEHIFADVVTSKYAVSMNSATSALVAAVGALALPPGSEVLVPAQTMSASAACLLAWGIKPIFCDVESDTFSICPKSIVKNITPKTVGIIVVHLYGHPAKLGEILAICKQYNLKLIEDCSQAPLATYGNKYVGTFGDIGVFSFNFHKHVNCGEGGVAVTHDQEYRENLCDIRNHGEVRGFNALGRYSLPGYNFRLSELHAAIALEQTKKMGLLVNQKRENAARLMEALSDFSWARLPIIDPICTHSFYDFPIVFDVEYLGCSIDDIERLGKYHNLPLTKTYMPIYLQEVYQSKLRAESETRYAKGYCSNAEQLYSQTALTFEICSYEVSQDLYAKFNKLFSLIEQLGDETNRG